ncbi:MAG: hypothetical protein NVS9B1_18310 [Candidatus Dormibacteraceae bacterium]
MTPQLGRYTAGAPEIVRSELRTLREEIGRRNLRLAAALLAAIDTLAGAGVTALPIKGVVLAQQLYGGLAERECADIDLLVDPDSREVAIAALAVAGWITTPAPAAAVHLIRRTQVVIELEREGVPLDLHWDLFEPHFAVRLAAAPMRAAAVPVALAGRSLRVLADEDLVLFLAVHAAKHSWGRLLWIADLARAFGLPLDWAAVRRRAEAAGVARMLGVGAALVGSLFDVQTPLSPDLAARRIAASVGAGLARPAGSDGRARPVKIQLRARDGMRDRLRYVARGLGEPTLDDWRVLPVPAGLGFVLRGVRPLRLLVRHGHAGARRFLQPGYRVISDRIVQPAIDRWYGIETAGHHRDPRVGAAGGHPYQPTGWRALNAAFDLLTEDGVDRADVLIDLGCGKGRALAVASRLPLDRVIGVEVSAVLVATSRANVEVLRLRMRSRELEVVQDDARTFRFPDDATILYLYNPLRAVALVAALDHLHESLRRRPRRFRILYVQPLAEAEVVAAGFRPSRRRRMWASGLRIVLFERPA